MFEVKTRLESTLLDAILAGHKLLSTMRWSLRTGMRPGLDRLSFSCQVLRCWRIFSYCIAASRRSHRLFKGSKYFWMNYLLLQLTLKYDVEISRVLIFFFIFFFFDKKMHISILLNHQNSKLYTFKAWYHLAIKAGKSVRTPTFTNHYLQY